MANELAISALMNYSDSNGTQASLPQVLAPLLVSVTTKIIFRGTQLVGTSIGVINIGSIATLGWYILVNRDPVNTIRLYNSTVGIIINQMFPGEFCMGRFGQGITAPAALAVGAPCQMDVLICSA